MTGTRIYNIIVKFVIAVIVMLLCLLLPVHIILRLLIGIIAAGMCLIMLSRALRYTSFQYAYYDFASKIIYKNNGKYYCPCCNKRMPSFYDHGFAADSERFNPEAFKGINQNVYCPLCDSAPRQRIIASYLNDNKDLLKGRNLLFAPELSIMLWLRHNNLKVTTADLYDRKADLKLDITNIDLPDESYDVIFCNHVLEHVNDYKKTLKELRRILAPNGTLIISFPIDDRYDLVCEDVADTPEERKKLYGQHDHVRIFGKNSERILEEAGFNVKTIDTSVMDKSIVPITGPAYYDSNRIFVCSKV